MDGLQFNHVPPFQRRGEFGRFSPARQAENTTYADMGLDERSTMRIEVKGKKAKVLNDAKQPVLVVNDLKLDEGAAGGVGFWVDNGTEGYFTDLEVRAE